MVAVNPAVRVQFRSMYPLLWREVLVTCSFVSQPIAQAVSVPTFASASGHPRFSTCTASVISSVLPATFGSLPGDLSSAQTLQDIQLLSDLFSVPPSAVHCLQ